VVGSARLLIGHEKHEKHERAFSSEIGFLMRALGAQPMPNDGSKRPIFVFFVVLFSEFDPHSTS
jgi:hypothetical protein